MDRRALLTTAAWAAPAIATQRVGVAWANHYPPPSKGRGAGEVIDETGNIIVDEVCPPIC